MTTTPPEDSWPTPEGETVVVRNEGDTLVGAEPPVPPPAAGPPPDRRIGAGMLLAIGAILLVAAGIALAYFLTHRSHHKQVTTVVVTTAPTPVVKKVAVPRVVGLKEQDALVKLASVGLRPKEVYKPTRQPKGVVVSQAPQEATEVKKGTQVKLVIDSGAPKVAVPSVTGMSAAEAQAALDKEGLDSTTTQVTSSKPAGSVVDQAPKAGAKLAKGSTVTLSVAKAPAQTTSTPTTTPTTPTTTAAQQTTTAPATPQTATMPNVTSQDEASAASAMGSAGILPSLFFVPSNDPLGTVEQQAKAAGTQVPFHSHVQINISTGPGNKPQQTVPNVVGMTLQQAVGAMNAAHLRLIYLKYPVTTQAQAGKIVQQSPLSSGHAPQNAQVLVFLGALQK
jgi:eukaryotic-like serine/threonine-protein kinase